MDDTYDFGDGNGPVPAHKHHFGGGWVANTARVNEDSYVGADAVVFGFASVYNGAYIAESSRIFGSALVARVQIADKVEVSGRAIVRIPPSLEYADYMVTIQGDATIGGDSKIIFGCQILFTPRNPVPVIPRIDAAILSQLMSGGNLYMSQYHTCESTHCRAGWAIHLAGRAGYELEKECGPWLAGSLIYQVSRPYMPPPNFFQDNEPALVDIRKCAEMCGR